MGGLFSKKEKSRITEQDRAVLSLKKQRDQAHTTRMRSSRRTFITLKKKIQPVKIVCWRVTTLSRLEHSGFNY
jgi:hypothetical protein